MARLRVARLLLSSLLCLIAGYADVVTLVRHDAFAASMTGNVVLVGRGVGVHAQAGSHGTWFYVAVLGCYYLGSLTYHWLHERIPGLAGTVSGIFFGTIAVAVDVFFNLISEHSMLDFYARSWFVCGLTPVFGVQAAMSTDRCLGIATTAMGVHLDVLARALARLLAKPRLAGCCPDGDKAGLEEWDRLLASAVAVSSFIVGAVVGNVAARSVPHARWCYLGVGPAVALALVAGDCLFGPRALQEAAAQQLPAEGEGEAGACEVPSPPALNSKGASGSGDLSASDLSDSSDGSDGSDADGVHEPPGQGILRPPAARG